MARARKCDRCGKLYESYKTKYDGTNVNGITMVNIDDDRYYFKHKLMDLCPECMKEFQDWLRR